MYSPDYQRVKRGRAYFYWEHSDRCKMAQCSTSILSIRLMTLNINYYYENEYWAFLRGKFHKVALVTDIVAKCCIHIFEILVINNKFS